MIPSDVANNYAVLDGTYNRIVKVNDALRRTRHDANAALNILHGGYWDRQACHDAALKLAKLRELDMDSWYANDFYRLANERVLRGGQLDVGTLRKIIQEQSVPDQE